VNLRDVRARIVLEEARRLGLDVADLIAASTAESLLTVADWIAEITPSFGQSTAATYRPYWRLAIEHLGDRRIAELTTADLVAVVERAETRARHNRPTSTGRASRETCVAALRALFARAVAAGVLATSPAAALTKPRRSASRRRALDDTEVGELADAVRTTSNDPDLDLLLLRFHLESGARRQGALNLTCRDLDARRSTIWLREKLDQEREQPVSPSLVSLLHTHARTRSAEPDGYVFRTRAGRPIGGRRYDLLFARARTCLSWDIRIPVSAHVLRHTAITNVGRVAGYPVAQAFAGHAPSTVTGRYLHATLTEVAAAVAVLTGEAHPLATGVRLRSCAQRAGRRR
jgi:integrase/recombinase XerC